jgi:hypothetical protein
MKRWLPPALAFLFARALLFAAGLRAFRADERDQIWSLESWVRWDARHYLDIAGDGYRLLSCASVAGYAPQDWCGNTGWFPGYPALLKPLLTAGLPAPAAAALVSGAFAFLALHALWTRFLDAEPTRANLAALALAAVAPGAVYQHAAFPISLLLFLLIRALDAFARGRPLAAGLFGAAAAFTYPSGALVAPVMVAAALLLRKPAAPALTALLLTAAGTAAVLLLHQLTVSDWQAFFKVQRKYGFGGGWPQRALLERLAPLFDPEGTLFPALQTLLVLLLMLGVAPCLPRALRRADRERDVLLSLHALAFWLFPLLLGGGLSLHRADALLMPGAALARRLPAPLAWAVLLACAFTAFRVAARYFRGVLV